MPLSPTVSNNSLDNYVDRKLNLSAEKDFDFFDSAPTIVPLAKDGKLSRDFDFFDSAPTFVPLVDDNFKSNGDLKGLWPLDQTSLRPSSVLTDKLISTINASIKTFKPSKSLQLLTSHNRYSFRIEAREPTAEIDLVISGGGLKGYYLCGCVAVLQKQLKDNNIRIARVSGASAGAWSALFICTGVSTALWIESYHRCFANPHKTIHEVYLDDLWPLVKSAIPENAYEICTGRMFISITVLTATGFQNMIVSEFFSNEDLLEACLASSTIPYVTERALYRTFRGMKVIDGGLVNNTPIFKDGLRRQLVFRMSQIEYPWRLLINPVDTCIDALVIRGALQMARFFGGEYIPAIAWLEKKEKEQDLIRPGHRIRSFIAPLAVAALVFFRTSGISTLLDLLDVTFAVGTIAQKSTVINFRDADKEFTSNPLVYSIGAVYATIVSIVRRFNVLL